MSGGSVVTPRPGSVSKSRLPVPEGGVPGSFPVFCPRAPEGRRASPITTVVGVSVVLGHRKVCQLTGRVAALVADRPGWKSRQISCVTSASDFAFLNLFPSLPNGWS